MTAFLEAVADRASVDVDRTREVLERHNVIAQPDKGSPVNLRIRRLRFTGTKTTSDGEAPVDFDRDFETGLTVIASDRNLVGKSTLVWLVRWALTGRRPKPVNTQIGSWINTVTLDAAAGETAFTVSFAVSHQPFSGVLAVAGRAEQRFTTETGFEATIAEFMLDALNLSKLPGFQKQKGRQSDAEGAAVKHGWATHFPALHIRGDHVDFLLGDHKDHQPGVLLQVFLGLPWALTHRAADVAQKVLDNSRAAATRLQATQAQQIQDKLKPLTDEAARIDADLKKLDAAGPGLTVAELERRHDTYAGALTRLADSDRIVAATRQAVIEAQTLLDEADKVVRAARERRVLRPLLKALAPVHCPRCEEGFDDERLAAEEHQHACSVCARPLAAVEDETADADAEQAEQDLAAALAALAAAEEEHRTAVRERDSRASEVQDAKGDLPTVARAADVARRLELQLRRAELTGRVAQAEEAVGSPADEEDPEERKVIAAALSEADKRRKSASEQLLTQLGKEVVRVATQIGMRDLQHARPDLAARLPVTIAGHEDWFSARTSGEKLRLKIAVVVALLRVGERHGVGRHPGLLLIDSPGGEEMDPDDLRVVLAELGRLCEETSHMQIIVATARGDVVREAVDADRIIHGEDWGAVW